MPPRTGDADGVLIAAAREGDAEAFGALWERVRDPVYGLCRHVTGCRTDALDALQETQIAVWRAIGGYEGRAAFCVWVMAIARNAALGVVRRRQPHDHLLFQESAEPLAVESGFDETVAGLVDLRRALATIGPAHRDTLLLWAGGLTYAETAAVLEVPVNTVKIRIFRSRRALRDLLS